MKHEYHESPKTGENFEKLARAVLHSPKVAVPKNRPKKKVTRRKNHGRLTQVLGERSEISSKGRARNTSHSGTSEATRSNQATRGSQF